MNRAVIDLAYLAAAVLFILGLKGLTHPRTAVRGNLLGAIGMLLAVVVTLFSEGVIDWGLIFVGLIVGSAGGAYIAGTIQMTAMPQLVALFNGFGGGASVLVAGAYLAGTTRSEITADVLAATAASGLIGAVTFSGSLVAFAKLQEFDFIKEIRFQGQQLVNLLLSVGSVGLALLIVISPESALIWYWLMVLLALGLGGLLVVYIGGADMPVVIALLNSYSGLAATATGFVLSNNVLIIAGSWRRT